MRTKATWYGKQERVTFFYQKKTNRQEKRQEKIEKGQRAWVELFLCPNQTEASIPPSRIKETIMAMLYFANFY